jgi:preprotein translocase subunit SecD
MTVAAVVGAVVFVGGLAACASSRSNGNDQDGQGAQPAASSQQHPTTLWKAKDAPCPAHPVDHASAGAVLRDENGCVQLVSLGGTFNSPVKATAGESHGQWQVHVTLDDHQAATLTSATNAAVGKELAIVNQGTLLTAPSVAAPTSTTSQILISGTSKAQARRFALLLNKS